MKANLKTPWLLVSMMPLLICPLVSCGPFGGLPSSPATFTLFDPPGAVGTVATSINSAGAITGTYFTTGVLHHGFLRAPDGTITTFDAPGAGTGFDQGTLPNSINPTGAITGYYSDANSVGHGFLRAPDGTITTFDVPGAGTAFSLGTFAVSINPAGAITGYDIDASHNRHGFLRATDGTITIFDGPVVFFIAPNSINLAGEITGQYFDAGGTHGFLRIPDGPITIFDVPGPNSTSPVQCSYPCGPGINPDGTIAGDYDDASHQLHAFARAPDGTFTTFDAPGAGTGSGQGTFALGINSAGTITGYYSDANSVNHGFLRMPGGATTTFDPAGASAKPGQGTVALSINANGAITGYYVDASGSHGFVRD
jgi:hypothetical protein